MDSKRWFQGEIYACVKGTASQRFFSLLLQNAVSCRNIEEKEGAYRFRHLWKDRKKVRRYAEKTGMDYQAYSTHGLPVLWLLCIKRPMTLVAVCVSAAVILGMTQFVWKIDIEGNTNLSTYEIERRLAEQEIHNGIWKHTVDTRELEEQLLLQHKDLSYVSVTLDGSTLKIYVTERVQEPEMMYQETETGSLVSKGEFLVYSIVTEKGTPMVQKGDVVKEGEILISGYVASTADDGTVTYRAEKASGTVLGVSVYRFQDHIDRSGEIRIYEDTVQNALAFFYRGRQIYLWNPFSNAGDYDIISTEILSLNLPDGEFQIYHEEYQGYAMQPYEYTAEEMERMLADKMNYAAEVWMAESERLEIERTWDFTEGEDGMDAVLTIRVIEDITKESVLEELPQNEDTGGS